MKHASVSVETYLRFVITGVFFAFFKFCYIFGIQTVILKPKIALIGLQPRLCYDKAFKVNVFRLCFGIFTFVAT